MLGGCGGPPVILDLRTQSIPRTRWLGRLAHLSELSVQLPRPWSSPGQRGGRFRVTKTSPEASTEGKERQSGTVAAVAAAADGADGDNGHKELSTARHSLTSLTNVNPRRILSTLWDGCSLSSCHR